MGKLILSFIRFRADRVALLFLAILVIGLSFGLLISSVETIQIQVEQDLSESYRTTYDILVRPEGSRSNIEKQNGLVQPNHLNEIPGGITIAQYETIKYIPGVEVAAPIAIIGTFDLVFFEPLDVECEPGVYRLVNYVTMTDGVKDYFAYGQEFFICEKKGGDFYHLFDSAPYNLNEHAFYQHYSDELLPWFEGTIFRIPILIAAIDLEEEQKLISLADAIVEGNYLSNIQAGNPFQAPQIPIILNKEIYSDFWFKTKWEKVDLDIQQESLNKENIEVDQISNLNSTEINSWVFSDSDAYEKALQKLKNNTNETGVYSFDASPGKLSYEILETAHSEYPILLKANIELSSLSWGAMISIASDLVDFNHISLEASYRENSEGSLGGGLNLSFQGLYDINLLPQFSEKNQVPLETYYLPKTVLVMDENGNPIEPTPLIPTLSDTGYITSPPLALTTIENGAWLNVYAEDGPISSIRVRVEGPEEFTPELQETVEEIASSIVVATGLDVDIIAGSSPQKVLVYLEGDKHVPSPGYVEEYWIQLNTNEFISQQISIFNLLVFIVLLIVTVVYILNTCTVNMNARKKEFGILKALGWRNSSISLLFVIENILIAAFASLIAGGATLLLANLFSLEVPENSFLIVLVLGIALTLIGSLVPALQISTIRPKDIMERGEISKTTFPIRHFSLFGVSVQQLAAKPTRLILALVTITISSAMFFTMLAAVSISRGFISATLLGEHIAGHIGPTHFIICFVALVIAGIALLDIQLMSVFERKREIGIMKAIGWNNKTIFRLFTFEAVIIGLTGSIFGCVVGLIVISNVYETFMPAVLIASLATILVSLIVSIISAAYPSRRASQIPPGEVIRYE